MMNLSNRERWLYTLRYKPVDRVPDCEFATWEQTIARWSHEGMDTRTLVGMGGETEFLVYYFGLDSENDGPGLDINVGLLPAFERVVLEDRGQKVLFQDEDGAISEQLKPEYGASIPDYIRYAIKTRADWQRVRDERLDPDCPKRIPQNLEVYARRLHNADYLVSVFVGSLYGWIRNWVGVEQLSLMLYDDRPLVEEMMEHLTQLTLHVLGKLAGKGLKIDQGDWWEDMCYKAGPLISPRMFKELMVPRYKRITDYMHREFETEFQMLDCDGNIHELIPLWLEGGINVMFPLEAAWTDAYQISSDFGTRVALRGAFDKRALIAGPAAIDAEFDRLRPLLQRGGFIPHTDHLVPPDVSFENYLYYRRKKCEVIGKSWREPGIQRQPGTLTDWRLLGPFDNEDRRGLDTAYLPEQHPEAEGPIMGKHRTILSWKPYTGTTGSGYVNLSESISPEPWCVAYAACSIYTPRERDSFLELGSDGGLQVWLNGEQVWRKDADRVARPRQDLALIRLREGWNQVLVKATHTKGEWGFHFRLTDDRGEAWTDLQTASNFQPGTQKR